MNYYELIESTKTRDTEKNNTIYHDLMSIPGLTDEKLITYFLQLRDNNLTDKEKIYNAQIKEEIKRIEENIKNEKDTIKKAEDIIKISKENIKEYKKELQELEKDIIKWVNY